MDRHRPAAACLRAGRALGAALLTLASAACATGSTAAREADPRDPVLGYWQFVEAGEDAARGPEAFPQPGSSLLVEPDSFAPHMAGGLWARMEIRCSRSRRRASPAPTPVTREDSSWSATALGWS